MHRPVRTIILAAAALSMALAASSAAAIEVSPAGEITSSSLGLLTFRSSVANFECRFTLNGTLASTVANESGAHVGTVTSGAANECRNGSVRLLFAEGGWELTLVEAFVLGEEEGEVELLFSNVQLLIEVIGVSCLYTGTVRANLPASGNPLTTGLVTITATNIRRASGSIFCPSTGEFAGTFALSTQTLTLP